MIGTTFLKSIALLLYGIHIITLTDNNVRELQKIKNSVYKCILGAAHYNPNVALRGEIVASLMRKRVTNSKRNYVKVFKETEMNYLNQDYGPS